MNDYQIMKHYYEQGFEVSVSVPFFGENKKIERRLLLKNGYSELKENKDWLINQDSKKLIKVSV